ncbi:hypothetical protein VYU27_005685 [Nannochloropsis oceanica]
MEEEETEEKEEEYDFEYSDDEEQEPDVELENEYYAAKGLKSQGKLDEALRGMQRMVALEMEREGGRGEWGFKALKQSVKMLFTLGRHEEMLRCYVFLLDNYASSSPSPSSSSIPSSISFSSFFPSSSSSSFPPSLPPATCGGGGGSSAAVTQPYVDHHGPNIADACRGRYHHRLVPLRP